MQHPGVKKEASGHTGSGSGRRAGLPPRDVESHELMYRLYELLKPWWGTFGGMESEFRTVSRRAALTLGFRVLGNQTFAIPMCNQQYSANRTASNFETVLRKWSDHPPPAT